jgi:hypothetical protein
MRVFELYCSVVEASALLGCYTEQVGSWLQIFQDNTSLPSSWVKQSKMNARHKCLYCIRDNVSGSLEKYGSQSGCWSMKLPPGSTQVSPLPHTFFITPHILVVTSCSSNLIAPPYPDNQSQPTASAIQKHIHLSTLFLLEYLTLESGTNRWS